MQSPKQLKISDFTYQLPKDKIALYPLPERDSAKLLVYKNGQIAEAVFTQLDHHLPQGALLVFNNTRVIPARLLFQKETGGQIEIFVLEPVAHGEIAGAMSSTGSIEYLCLVKGAAKWGKRILKKAISAGVAGINFYAECLIKENDAFRIRFSWQPPHLSFAEILEYFGEVPIPPYLHRPAGAADVERYQTIYARHKGSVAAPTAGLHFTNTVMQSLQQKNINTCFITLHVGAGTFKPVKSENLYSHEMHAEWISIDKTLLKTLLRNETVIPVGTTSLRTLESLYWLGLKSIAIPDITLPGLYISQWEVYEKNWPQASAKQALESLLHWMEKHDLQQLTTRTQILIAPGYSFKICKGLITNFHQPQSTLLLLIAALAGPAWKNIYEYALQNNFRFLSYGDSSYIESK